MKINIRAKESFDVTSGYLEQESFREYPHNGIDLNLQSGTDVLSPIEGIVTRVKDYGDSGAGKTIVVKTEENQEVIFAHLSEFHAKTGEKIHIGEKIAESGNTGFSTGPHLHLGVKENGSFVNPESVANDFQNLYTTKETLLDKLSFLFPDTTPFEFLIDKLVQYGFISINEFLFLLPAALFLTFTIFFGKNKTTSWILPLLYSFFVTEKFWG